MNAFLWLIPVWILIGVLARLYWSRAGHPDGYGFPWEIMFAGPFAFPIGSLWWGDAGAVWRRSVRYFGVWAALWGVDISHSPMLMFLGMAAWPTVVALGLASLYDASPGWWILLCAVAVLVLWLEYLWWRATFSMIHRENVQMEEDNGD